MTLEHDTTIRPYRHGRFKVFQYMISAEKGRPSFWSLNYSVLMNGTTDELLTKLYATCDSPSSECSFMSRLASSSS
ncbi:MAG TPA: hypothetical protein VMU28_08435, partial [Terriglobales bacterium]|nr:hypothetical protein [Terriglobales bacterium]